MHIGQKYLITADNWFFAPNGENYRGVFGTVHGVIDSETALGIKTNRNSTNWYVAIGDMILAGCQIHYAIRAENYSKIPPMAEVDYEGKRHVSPGAITRIYNADASGLSVFIEHNHDGDKMRRHCEILLTQIDFLTEATGQGLDDEDAAMVELIRADLAKFGGTDG